MQELEKIHNWAVAADETGQCATAFECFHRVIAIEPTNDKAYYRAAKNLLQIGRISAAAHYLMQINRHAVPKPWLIDIAFGELYLAQFKLAEAEKHFRSAWDIGKVSSVPAVFLADYLIKLERFNEASSVLLESLLTAQDELDEVYFNLAIIRRAESNYPAARDFLLKAIEIDPDYQDAARVLSDVNLCMDTMRLIDA